MVEERTGRVPWTVTLRRHGRTVREGKKDEAAKLRRPLDFAEISFKFSLLGYAFDNVRTPFRCLHAKGFQCFPVRGSAICLGLLDAIKDVHYYPLRRLSFERDKPFPRG